MAEKKAAADKKAAERKALEAKKAADKKAAAEKKVAAEKKAASIKQPNTVKKSVSEQKRDGKTQLLSVSVSVNTGKIAGIISIGVVASALLVTALVFIAN